MYADDLDNLDDDPLMLGDLLRRPLDPRCVGEGFSATIDDIEPVFDDDDDDGPAWMPRSLRRREWEPDIIVRHQIPPVVNSWRRHLYQIQVKAGSRQDVGQRTPYPYGMDWAQGHIKIGGVRLADGLPPVVLFDAAGCITTLHTTDHNFTYPCGVLIVNNTIYVRSYPALVGLHAIIAHDNRLVETTDPMTITITTKNSPPLINCSPLEEEYHVLSTF